MARLSMCCCRPRAAVALLGLLTAVALIPLAGCGNSANDWLYQGRFLADRGDHEQAIECFGKALEADPKLPGAYQLRALSYRQMGELEKALDDQNRALELATESEEPPANAYFSRGVTLQMLGRHEDAVVDFRKAGELGEDTDAFHSHFGRSLVELKQFDEAKQHLELAIQLNPDFGKSYNDLGAVYLLENDAKRAVEMFSRSIELMPTWPLPYQNRAYAYTQLGELDKAAEDKQAAADLQGGKP